MKAIVANLNQKIVKKNNEIIQVGVAFSSNKEEARDNQIRMEIATKELDDNGLAFNTLKTDFDNA